MCEYCDALPAVKLVLCRRGYASDEVHDSRRAAASGSSAESQELTIENSLLIFIVSVKCSLSVQTNQGDLSEMLAVLTVTSTAIAARKSNHLFARESKVPQIQVILR